MDVRVRVRMRVCRKTEIWRYKRYNWLEMPLLPSIGKDFGV